MSTQEGREAGTPAARSTLSCVPAGQVTSQDKQGLSVQWEGVGGNRREGTGGLLAPLPIEMAPVGELLLRGAGGHVAVQLHHGGEEELHHLGCQHWGRR